MPTRLIREGFLDSDPLRAAGELAEVLFTRLMLVADDYGRFDGRVTVICRRCWPLGGPSEASIAERIAALVDNGLVVLYHVDGKPFICIPKFRQRLRQKNPSKYPDPAAYPQVDERMTVTRTTTDEHPPDARKTEVHSEVHAEAEVHKPPQSSAPKIETLAPPDAVGALAKVAMNKLDRSGPHDDVRAETDTPAGRLAAVCLRNSIRATPFHPLVVEWAKQGVTVDGLRSAIATARLRKPLPEQIPVAYIDTILGDKSKPIDRSWKTDEAKAQALCRDLGIPWARAGELPDAFHARIDKALAERARSQVA